MTVMSCCCGVFICLVCGLVTTCIFVFLAYRYLTASSDVAEVEHGEQSKMLSLKESDSGSIPAGVLSKVNDVTVLEKTATFSVNGHVRLVIDVSYTLQNLFRLYRVLLRKSAVGWTIVTVCLSVFRLVRLFVCSLFCVQLHISFFNYSHVSTAVRDALNWLSFPQRTTYKLCLVTSKFLHRLAPTYLSSYWAPLASVPGRCQLQFTDANKLSTPRTLGPRSFSVSGPASWNAVPPTLRDTDPTLRSFLSCSRLLRFLCD